MNKIFDIVEILSEVTLESGRDYVINGIVPLSDGTIISGIIYDGSEPTPVPVANAPVMLMENLSGTSTNICQTLTTDNGFYILSIAEVNPSATYSIKTSINPEPDDTDLDDVELLTQQ